eukprot:3481186-Alexandrium_andersonii.AAC.1
MTSTITRTTTEPCAPCASGYNLGDSGARGPRYSLGPVAGTTMATLPSAATLVAMPRPRSPKSGAA